ncbi:MAG TPA: DNA topoisomerase VI subunit B [Phycisphaerales bacterium]|nr:DNA topoisomerase VI subunit B [Phycisphaerales bacterium]
MTQATLARSNTSHRNQAAAMSSKKSPARVTAETMAAKQRDISVSEFFAKNRHLLGFDNPRKALLTTVKEAVDNSLDACEEAGILPEIVVVIEDLQPDRPASAKSSRYRISVVDNGPGIVRKQVENVFGRLLFGSKFHRLKMSRGQQGIGISAAGMYGLITTGKPMMIQTRPNAHKPAHHIELAMNTKTNRAEVTVDEETDDFPLRRLREIIPETRELAAKGEFLSNKDFPTGTSVSIELEGKYQRGRGSVDEFLELTAIANPHAKITFVRPTRVVEEEEDVPLLKGKKGGPAKDAGSGGAGEGETRAPGAQAPAPSALAVTEDLGALVIFPRAVSELPPETKEIQPHPKGIELGTLLQMLKDYQESDGGTLYNFLQEKFSRVSPQTAAEFCKAIGVSSRVKVADIEPPQAEALYKAFQEARLAPPPTDCLAPIGVQQLLKGMFKGVRAEFYAASSREPEVYRGRPFQIEAAIAFGGELGADETARVIRFANRVPLLFQQSACSSFKSVTETNWRNYDLQHPRGGLPIGPLVIMIHMASVWVPFTSESKEAIADYDEIRKEMKLALMECGRKLGTYLRKRAKMRRESERRDVFERYIGEIAQAVNAITGEDAKKLYEALLTQAKKRTAIADQQLDDEGRRVREEDPADQDGVLIVEGIERTSERANEGEDTTPGTKLSKAEAARLKVASMANDEPSLLDVKPVKRGEGKAAKKPTSPRRSREKTEEPKPSKHEKQEPAMAAGKKPKPKMRLVNGKLVPVDEGPGLF